jgi:hypothetical protein
MVNPEGGELMEKRETTKKEIKGKVKSMERLETGEDLIEERSVKATRALIQTLLQTLKSFRLYESNHPILNKFLERLKRDFDLYFEEFDSFSIHVGEGRLFYCGKVIYENQDIKESLAFFFFKDGIRELKFLRGLEFKEIMDFLHIVKKSETVNRMEDDLVTLLWEKEFPHIHFTIVDDFLDGETRWVPGSEEDFIERIEFRGFQGSGFEDSTSFEMEKGAPPFEREGLRQLLNPKPGQSLVQACELTPFELEEINRELQEERAPEHLIHLIENLIEILLHLGEDVSAYENMISYFERIIGSFFERGEIQQALFILRRLNETLETMVLKDKQIFAVRQILEAFSTPRSPALLKEIILKAGEMGSEWVLQYLQLLSKKAIGPLYHLLSSLESGKWRKMVCDRLVELSQGEIQPFLPFLKENNPFLISHLLYILGKIGHPTTPLYLESWVSHPDPKVREETLQLLKRFGEKGKGLIQKCLEDPMAEIRAKASLLFAKVAKEEAVKILSEIILSKEFLKRDYEEKVAFFRALGETGSPEVIPMLKKIAEKKRWFQKEKWEEMRLCATHTLQLLGRDEVLSKTQGKQKVASMAQSIH